MQSREWAAVFAECKGAATCQRLSTTCSPEAVAWATYTVFHYATPDTIRALRAALAKSVATPTKPSSNGDTVPRNSSSSSPNES
jgi:hypothetical protein